MNTKYLVPITNNQLGAVNFILSLCCPKYKKEESLLDYDRWHEVVFPVDLVIPHWPRNKPYDRLFKVFRLFRLLEPRAYLVVLLISNALCDFMQFILDSINLLKYLFLEVKTKTSVYGIVLLQRSVICFSV
jgi:hypothetical protein